MLSTPVLRAHVGHVHLHGRGAVPRRPRALAAAGRLAVAEAEEDGGPGRRFEEAVLGGEDLGGREAALVQWDVRADQERQRVGQRRVGDGGRRVHVRQHLAGRPREVECAEALLVSGGGDLHHGPCAFPYSFIKA